MTDERDDRGDERSEDRPKVKFTDKRRVRDDAGEEPPSPAPPGGERSEPEPQDELATARAQADEYLDDLKRLKAEFDNYRKRVLKEQTRTLELAAEPLVVKLLEVLDEFQLAVIAADQNPELEKFRRGVELVYAKLQDILRSEGLERIDAEGKPFDPELHEALLQSDEGEGELYVEDVLRPGYTLRGRVIRPAGVKVARR